MKADKPYKKAFGCGGVLLVGMLFYQSVRAYLADRSLNVYLVGSLLSLLISCLVPAIITGVWASRSERRWSWGRFIGSFLISYLAIQVFFSFLFLSLFLFPIAIVFVTPFIVLFVLLVRGRVKAAAVVFAISAILLACFIIYGQHYRRSTAGHIVRWFRGEGGALQTINDLAEDIRREPTLAPLQVWGTETLARFRAGQIQTKGFPSYWWDSRVAVKLARQERPEFIKYQWGETNQFGEEEPEILIVLGANKQPEVVAIAWYSHGVEIGPPEYCMPYESWYAGLYVKAKPGVYVYDNYK